MNVQVLVAGEAVLHVDVVVEESCSGKVLPPHSWVLHVPERDGRHFKKCAAIIG